MAAINKRYSKYISDRYDYGVLLIHPLYVHLRSNFQKKADKLGTVF